MSTEKNDLLIQSLAFYVTELCLKELSCCCDISLFSKELLNPLKTNVPIIQIPGKRFTESDMQKMYTFYISL